MDREAVLANKEQILVWILNEITPSELVERADLSSTFQLFLRKFSATDFNALLSKTVPLVSEVGLCSNCNQRQNSPSSTPHLQPSGHGTLSLQTAPTPFLASRYPSSVLGIAESSRPGNKVPIPTAPLVWTSSISSCARLPPPAFSPVVLLGNSLYHTPDFAKHYFESRVGPKQAALARRALAAIIEVRENPKKGHAADFWSKSLNIVTAEDSSVPPIRRVQDSRDKIENGSAHLQIASHLAHLYYAHSVDEEERFLGDQEQPKHRKRKTSAFLNVAQTLNKTSDDVSRDYNECLRYKYLLEKGGPGILLSLGSGVLSLWRKEITNKTVDFLLEYLRHHLAVDNSSAGELDEYARKVIHNGFFAYGWTNSEEGRWRLDNKSWLMQILYPGGADPARPSTPKRRKKDHPQPHECAQISSDLEETSSLTSRFRSGSLEYTAPVTDISSASAEAQHYLVSPEASIEGTLPEQCSDEPVYDNAPDPLSALPLSLSTSLDSPQAEGQRNLRTSVPHNTEITFQDSSTQATDQTSFFQGPEYNLYSITNGTLEDTYSWNLSSLGDFESDMDWSNDPYAANNFSLRPEFDLFQINQSGLETTYSYDITN